MNPFDRYMSRSVDVAMGQFAGVEEGQKEVEFQDKSYAASVDPRTSSEVSGAGGKTTIWRQNLYFSVGEFKSSGIRQGSTLTVRGKRVRVMEIENAGAYVRVAVGGVNEGTRL